MVPEYKTCATCTIFVCLFVWNIYETIHLCDNAKILSNLREKQEWLQVSFERELREHGERLVRGGDDRWRSDDLVNRRIIRTKRGIGYTQNRTKPNKKVNRFVATFKAEFDRDRWAFQTKYGERITTGVQRADRTVVLDSIIYNVWNYTKFQRNVVFGYHRKSGKFTVKKNGLYFIYAQVTFHVDSDSKVYRIYRNNDTVPLAECISHTTVSVSNGSAVNPASPGGDVMGGVSHGVQSAESARDMRRQMAEVETEGPLVSTIPLDYVQCSTNTVTSLSRRDNIFIKSDGKETIISVKGYNTFWGLIKL